MRASSGQPPLPPSQPTSSTRATSTPRIVILGSGGAGKSTLAAHIAQACQVSCIDLDELYWLSNWETRSTEEFRQRVDEATGPGHEGWVVAGNYSACRDILWTRARTLIWLDYDFSVVMKRLLLRTARRCLTQEPLFGTTNTETLARIVSRDSLIWWVIKTWRKRKHEYPRAFARPEHAHLQVIRLRDPAQAEALLAAYRST